MYGKAFASMYEGSLVGAGSVVFAVWGYVIAKMEPDKQVGAQVRLNPKLLAPILGDSENNVSEAIKYLCNPDPESSTKTEEGRRLVRIGQFDYRVVNGAKYRAIRTSEERREYKRQWQASKRKKTIRNTPSLREQRYGETGDEAYLGQGRA